MAPGDHRARVHHRVDAPVLVREVVAAPAREGVELDDGEARVDNVRYLQKLPDRTLLELVLHEGRNRIVRRMMDAVGYPVTDLVRTRMG